MRWTGIGHPFRHIRELIGDELQRARDVGQRRRREPAVVAQERQHLFQHRAHLVEIGKHAAAMRRVLDELGAQAHPRDRRAQIVADRGEHPGAIIHQSGDALAHAVERLRHRADFLGAAFGKRRGRAVQAESFGGAGKRRQRCGKRPRGPDAEQRDADDGKQQRHHPWSAPERRRPPFRRRVRRNDSAVGQDNADPLRGIAT